MNTIKELNSQNDDLHPGNIIKTENAFYMVTNEYRLVNLQTGKITTMKYYKATDVNEYKCLYWDATITIH